MLHVNHDVIFHREITGNYILVMGMVLKSSGTYTLGIGILVESSGTEAWGWVGTLLNNSSTYTLVMGMVLKSSGTELCGRTVCLFGLCSPQINFANIYRIKAKSFSQNVFQNSYMPFKFCLVIYCSNSQIQT